MAMNWLASNAYSGTPPNAVVAGHDIDGATIYVGRAYHEGDLIPAKVMPSKQVAYVPHGGQEIEKHEFHLLTGVGFQWVPSSNGHVPADAVLAGNQSDGQPLYVGRANVGGSLAVGKVHPGHHTIYVPFDSKEHSFQQYEVLIAPKRSILPAGAISAVYDQDSCMEILKDDFEMLSYSKVSWVKCNASNRAVPPFSVNASNLAVPTFSVTASNGAVPPFSVTASNLAVPTFSVTASNLAVPTFSVTASNRAVPTQYTEGEPLHIGRAHHEGSLTVGKVHMSHHQVHIPFGSRAVSIHSEIEVLTDN